MKSVRERRGVKESMKVGRKNFVQNFEKASALASPSLPRSSLHCYLRPVFVFLCSYDNLWLPNFQNHDE